MIRSITITRTTLLASALGFAGLLAGCGGVLEQGEDNDDITEANISRVCQYAKTSDGVGSTKHALNGCVPSIGSEIPRPWPKQPQSGAIPLSCYWIGYLYYRCDYPPCQACDYRYYMQNLYCFSTCPGY